MPVTSEIKLNLDGLKKLQEAAGRTMYVKVGSLANKAVRPDSPGINNPTIGMAQEFGTSKIPPRSWLRMPLEFGKERLIKLLMKQRVKDLFEDNRFKDILKLIGVEAESIISEAFATGGYGNWAPNAPSTIAAKGSSKPLIDKAELVKSVGSQVVIE